MDKINENRLLTGAEREAIWKKYLADHPDPEYASACDFTYLNRMIEAQRDLTASIKDAECQAQLNQLTFDLGNTAKEACQARIERIFRQFLNRIHQSDMSWYIEFKKQEGIK